MSQMEQAIFTNMCMVYDDKGNILVQDRLNPDWSGITFPGGHVEPSESFVDSVIREVREETGLTIKNPVLCGIKQWQRPTGGRYVVLLYKTNCFTGTLCSSDEGKVFWIPRADLEQQKLANGFLENIKVFEQDNLSEFFYYQEEGQWKYRLL